MKTCKQNGFSIIEVLVTIIVLSTGMLGIAALYVEGLRSGHTALARTKAVNLAADMADRIRVNRAGEAAYVTNFTNAGAVPARQCGARGGIAAEDCAAPDMAAYDIWLWKTMIGNSDNIDAKKIGLANGIGSITRNAATFPVSFTIRIDWSEKDMTQRYALTFAL